MDGDNRILYVPLENRVRELDARLLLSLKAASANFQVVLGPRGYFTANRDLLPRGFYAFKTLNQIDATEMSSVQKYGHTPMAWDEEGPGQIIPKIYLKSINDEAVGHAQKVYAWGENQAHALASKYPQAAHKIEALGNPRWDILRPEYRRFFAPEADAIKERYGRFILINTNFSSYNAWHPDAFKRIAGIADETGVFKKDDEADQQLLKDIFAFEEGTFKTYAELIPSISAAFPQHTIVVRPHPTENHERWKEIVAPFANVKYVYDGVVVPWLLAAEAVIQNSCTTGVESFTLGKPVVSYCKYNSPLLEWHLANQVCPRAHDETQLIDYLRKFINDPASFDALNAVGKQILAKHISHLDGELSSSAIISSFAAHAIAREQQGAVFDRTFSMSQSLRAYQMTKYQRLKLPPIEAQDIFEKLRRIAKIDPSIRTISMSHIAESCFFFRRAAA